MADDKPKDHVDKPKDHPVPKITAQNLTAKKSDALSMLTSYSGQALNLINKLETIMAYISDNGFLSNGTNPIVDADCIGENSHLTATMVNTLVTELQVADTSLLAIKPLLRQTASSAN